MRLRLAFWLPLLFWATTAATADAQEVESIASASYAPASCTMPPFTDVDIGSDYCPWIRQLKADGITSGCGGGNYCPAQPVTREQMAVLLERAMHDGPQPATLFGRFAGSGTVARTAPTGFSSLGGLKLEYASLTVPIGATLLLEQGAGFIAVQGMCDIAGTIQAAPLTGGGSSFMGGSGLGGSNGIGAPNSSAPVPYCLGGKGGSGGLVGGAFGGAGGGGSSNASLAAITAAAGFPTYLLCGGGGGGGGGTTEPNGFGGTGGPGGGIVYLECGDLHFTGIVEALGGSGEPGSATDGAGGGGGGGVIVLRARRATNTSGTMNASGGLDGGVMNNGTAGAAGFTSLEILEQP